jgi:hypothetical protein
MQFNRATDRHRKPRRRTRRKPIDGRTKTAKRIRELTAGYLATLGAPELREQAERVAQLVVLAETARNRALVGRGVSLDDVVRCERCADLALRRLGLPVGKPEPLEPTRGDILRAGIRSDDLIRGHTGR